MEGAYGHATNGNGYVRPVDPNRATIPIEDKLPPQNLDAERSVLAGCMMDAAVLADVVAMLTPDDFYRDAHQVVYRAILVLHANGKGVDMITVMEELESQGRYADVGGDDGLTDVCNSIPHTVNCRFHAEIVLQKSVMRRTIQLCAEVIRDGYSSTLTSSQVVRKLGNGLQRIMLSTPQPEDELDIRDQPDLPGDKAYHGVIGSMVKAIDPYTEASLPAILLQMLTSFGNLVGHDLHWTHEANKHHLNLFACIVGPTGVGRKGTSWAYVHNHFGDIDDDWRHRIRTGINSGESLIEQVADETTLRTGGLLSGVADKRLLMLETEFERILSVFTRQGDSLSVVLRQMWEHGDNGAHSRKNPVTCTGAHVSMIAHITPTAVREQLSLTEVANGLGNRFIWCWSTRSKDFSQRMPPRFDKAVIADHIFDLRRAFAYFHDQDRKGDAAKIPMFLEKSARELWRHALKGMQEPRPGHLGDLLVRAPAQVMRMAAIYAAADASFTIQTPHLEAALELWDYCVRSVEFIFRDRLGDKEAEKLLAALKAAGEAGITQTDVIRVVFQGNKASAKVGKILGRMVQAGLIHRTVDKAANNGTKPVTTWHLGPPLLSTPPLRTYESNGLHDLGPAGGDATS